MNAAISFARVDPDEKAAVYIEFLNFLALDQNEAVTFRYVLSFESVTQRCPENNMHTIVNKIVERKYSLRDSFVASHDMFYSFTRFAKISAFHSQYEEIKGIINQHCSSSDDGIQLSWKMVVDTGLEIHMNDIITRELIEERTCNKNKGEIYRLAMNIYYTFYYGNYARELLRVAVNKGLQVDSAYYILGMYPIYEYDLELGYLTKALTLNPNFEEAYVKIGDLSSSAINASERKKIDQSGINTGEKFLEQGVKIYPMNADLHYYLARVKYFLGDKVRAVTEAKNALLLSSSTEANELLEEMEGK